MEFAKRACFVSRLSNTEKSFRDALLNYEPNYAKICVRSAEWKALGYRYFDRATNDPIPPGCEFVFVAFAPENIEEESLARSRQRVPRHVDVIADILSSLSRKWEDRRQV